MNLTLRKNQSLMSKLIVASMIGLLLMSLLAQSVLAASDSTRIAKISSIEGQVYVKKSGGSKEFTAYRGMTLNQGDSLRTGSKSSVVLTVLDRDDEVTVDENSSLSISTLRADGAGKKTTLSMWSGSVYVKASKMTTGDELEIETPTAVMGVRGTNFIVIVKPEQGDTYVYVASGVVEAKVPKDNADKSTEGDTDVDTEPSTDANEEIYTYYIYPTMQGLFVPENEETGTEQQAILTNIDPDSFSKQTGEALIKALINNNPQAEEERIKLLQQLLDGEAPTDIPEILELDSQIGLIFLEGNMEELANILINHALFNGVVSKEQIEELIKNANEKTIEDIEIGDTNEFELTENQKEEQEQLRLTEQQRIMQQQQLEQERREQQEQNQALLDEIKQKQEQQKQQNELAETELNQQTLEKYMAGLTPEEREAFLENRSELLEDTLNEQQKEETSSSGSSGSSGQDQDEGSDLSSPEVRLLVEEGVQNTGTLDVVLENIRGIQALELHVGMDANAVDFVDQAGIITNPDHLFTSNINEYSDPIEHVDVHYGMLSNYYYHEIVYTVVNNVDGLAVDATEPKNILRIPFTKGYQTGQIQVLKLLIILDDGTTLDLGNLEHNVITLTFE